MKVPCGKDLFPPVLERAEKKRIDGDLGPTVFLVDLPSPASFSSWAVKPWKASAYRLFSSGKDRGAWSSATRGLGGSGASQ